MNLAKTRARAEIQAMHERNDPEARIQIIMKQMMKKKRKRKEKR